MKLFLFCEDVANSCMGTAMADSDRKAEKWIVDLVSGREDGGPRPLVAFVLCDKDGIRAVWTRSLEDAKDNAFPLLVKVTTRYEGPWKYVADPVVMIEPAALYEHVALAKYHVEAS